MNGQKMENVKLNKIEEKSHQMTKDELFALRQKQSGASRLAEYITGLRPDDPRMEERIIQDQRIIRAKYHLPTREERLHYLFDDSMENYEKMLFQRAEEIGYSVENNPHHKLFEVLEAEGIHDGYNKRIIAKTNKRDKKSFIKHVITLEHELIHALQPENMPTELREYEAHVGTRSIENFFTDDPVKNTRMIENGLFGTYIGGSVASWYRQDGTKSVFNNPDWFLKNVDGFTEQEIEEYKNKKPN